MARILMTVSLSWCALAVVSAASLRKRKMIHQDPDLEAEDNDNFEYGDKELAVSRGDQTDFSLHQFLEQDDGRQGSSTSDDDSGNRSLRKSVPWRQRTISIVRTHLTRPTLSSKPIRCANKK